MFGVSKWIEELQGFTKMKKVSGWQNWNVDTISMSGIARRWLSDIGWIMKKVERKGWEPSLLVKFVILNPSKA